MPEKPEPQPVDTGPETAPEQANLPEAVREYVRRHNKAIQDKILAGQPVTAKDLEFIENLKKWMALPAELRQQYPSLEELEKAEADGASPEDILEAAKRRLSVRQWLLFYRMAEESFGNSHREELIKEIDRIFDFPGEGEIITQMEINASGMEQPFELPENLVVDCLKLTACTGLSRLPRNLAANFLILEGCTKLTALPACLKVRREINVTGCGNGIKASAKNLGARVIDTGEPRNIVLTRSEKRSRFLYQSRHKIGVRRV